MGEGYLCGMESGYELFCIADYSLHSIPLENDVNLTKSLMLLMFTTSSRLSPDLTIVGHFNQWFLINAISFLVVQSFRRCPLSFGRY